MTKPKKDIEPKDTYGAFWNISPNSLLFAPDEVAQISLDRDYADGRMKGKTKKWFKKNVIDMTILVPTMMSRHGFLFPKKTVMKVFGAI